MAMVRAERAATYTTGTHTVELIVVRQRSTESLPTYAENAARDEVVLGRGELAPGWCEDGSSRTPDPTSRRGSDVTPAIVVSPNADSTHSTSSTNPRNDSTPQFSSIANTTSNANIASDSNSNDNGCVNANAHSNDRTNANTNAPSNDHTDANTNANPNPNTNTNANSNSEADASTIPIASANASANSTATANVSAPPDLQPDVPPPPFSSLLFAPHSSDPQHAESEYALTPVSSRTETVLGLPVSPSLSARRLRVQPSESEYALTPVHSRTPTETVLGLPVSPASSTRRLVPYQYEEGTPTYESIVTRPSSSSPASSAAAS